MAVFDTAEVHRLLNATFSNADYVGATTGSSLEVRSAVGNDTTAGTAIAGTTRQALPFATGAAARSINNSGAASFTSMPAATVNAVDIYDSAGTNRKAYGLLTTARTTASGDTLSFAAGSIVCAYG